MHFKFLLSVGLGSHYMGSASGFSVSCSSAVASSPSAAFPYHRNNDSFGISPVKALSPLSVNLKNVASVKNTVLRSTSSNNDFNPYESPQLDTNAISKYFFSGVVELSLFGLIFQLLDLALAQFQLSPSSFPTPLIAFLFYASSLKSRVFNPLNNQRPDPSKEASTGFRDRVMPSWTPPGVFFPIMWILIIGPIRAYSSVLVVSSTGIFFNPATMAFMLHLTVGDIWNTINNTEKRYGASVTGVFCVVLSVLNAAYQYYLVDPFAGKLLGGTALWLVTAAALITDTWRLNPGQDGQRVPLFPVVGEAETDFIWFSKKGSDSS